MKHYLFVLFVFFFSSCNSNINSSFTPKNIDQSYIKDYYSTSYILKDLSRNLTFYEQTFSKSYSNLINLLYKGSTHLLIVNQNNRILLDLQSLPEGLSLKGGGLDSPVCIQEFLGCMNENKTEDDDLHLILSSGKNITLEKNWIDNSILSSIISYGNYSFQLKNKSYDLKVSSVLFEHHSFFKYSFFTTRNKYNLNGLKDFLERYTFKIEEKGKF